MTRRPIILAAVSIIALLLIFWGINTTRRNPPQPITMTGFAMPEMSEGTTSAMTCSATHRNGIASVNIIRVTGTGLLRADTNPALEIADQTYSAQAIGKSRSATFNCIAVANNGDTYSTPLSTIVRDARAPEWAGAAPTVPANGSDGAAAGKVGVSFDITIAARDAGLGAGRGSPGGIYRITWTVPAGITVNNATYTTSGRPKGPPDNAAGPPNISQTFALTCTVVGAKTVNVKVTDTVENKLELDLGIECY